MVRVANKLIQSLVGLIKLLLGLIHVGIKVVEHLVLVGDLLIEVLGLVLDLPGDCLDVVEVLILILQLLLLHLNHLLRRVLLEVILGQLLRLALSVFIVDPGGDVVPDLAGDQALELTQALHKLLNALDALLQLFLAAISYIGEYLT